MRRSRGRDTGATAVEFALVLPLVLGLLGAVCTFALRAAYTSVAEHAARAAVRQAVERVPPSVTPSRFRSAADVAAAAQAALPDLGQVCAVEVPTPYDPRSGEPVTVTLRCSLPALQGFVGLASPLVDLSALAVVTGSASGRWE